MDERLAMSAFLLQLAQDRTEVLGVFLVFGAVPEQVLEEGGHRTLLGTRRPVGLVRTAGSAA
jgi:hypothetical protein